MSERFGPPAGYYNLFGRAEMRATRIMVAFIAVTVVLTAVIMYLVKLNNGLAVANAALQSERIMYGFPNGDGVFVSEKTIPDRHLRAFTSEFLDNYYNFSPESSYANANEALRMMSPRLRAVEEERLKLLAKQSAEQQITQVFSRTTPYKIEVTSAGYIVSFEAMRYRSTYNSVYGKAKFKIQLLLKPIKPSKHFEWAIVADDYKTQEIPL